MEEVFKSSVRSIKLVEFLKWARESFTYHEGKPLPQYGLLALPAIQRDAAWKADQVANLWDSVFRGLPLGALMLQNRGPNQKGRIATSGAMIKELQQGWNLLDGQQRLRSLLLGVYGPQLDKDYKDLRCVWIDLHDDKACRFQVTSSSQPFGYDEKGNRLSPTERSKARERYEPKDTNDTKDTEIKLYNRFCYTNELFENFLKAPDDFFLQTSTGVSRMPPESNPQGWPPLPAKFERKTIVEPPYAILPLHILFKIWQSELPNQRVAKILGLVGADKFEKVMEMLNAFEQAEIGLIDASSVAKPDSLNRLYDRIGAGGTPLSPEDRLFSIYKSYRGEFHNLVEDIFNNNGKVMAPSKIAVSAIRIANACAHAVKENMSHNVGNDAPDVIKFIEEIEAGPSSQLVVQLEQICLVEADTTCIFSTIFREVFVKLRYHRENNKRGIPGVMFRQIPMQLIQTLLFWKIQPIQRLDNEDNDILRFALGWLLIVHNNDKAASECFRMIREASDLSLQRLFLKLSENPSVSLELIKPYNMHKFLTASGEMVLWPFTDSRIVKIRQIIHDESGAHSDETWRVENFIKKWWRGAEVYLPWLQRRYLAAAFPGYDPTSDRDDDTPYDIDHMIPANSWRQTWNPAHFPGVTSDDDKKRVRWSRIDLGESIGNKWLVDMSSNRQWQDNTFHSKLAKIQTTGHSRSDYQLLLDDAFDTRAEKTWLNASEDKNWTEHRMLSFQQAIEHRTAWLYEKLYVEIGFSKWFGTLDE